MGKGAWWTALVVLLALLAVMGSGSAVAKEYEIGGYDIHLELTPEGSYIITERITFHFMEGEFTKANRRVPGRGFDSLRFISLEGVGVPVETQRVREGRNLQVDWTYPEVRGETSATFVLTYEAVGALRSIDQVNVIDWNPIGSEWTVPIRNIDVTIVLPDIVTESAGRILAQPESDLVMPVTRGNIHFHRDHLPPRTHYHVVVSFPEVITMTQTSSSRPSPPSPVGWMLLGFAVGFGLFYLERTRLRRPAPVPDPSGPGPDALNPLEMACLYHRYDQERRRGIVATIFSLAQAGYLRLVVRPRKGIFSWNEVYAEVLSDRSADVRPPGGSPRQGTSPVSVSPGGTPSGGGPTAGSLSKAERLLLDQLKKRKRLGQLARDQGFFRKLLNATHEQLANVGIIDRERVRARRSLLLSAIPFGLAAFGLVMAYGFNLHVPVLLTLSMITGFLCAARIAAASQINPLTPRGLHAYDRVKALIHEKMEQIEGLVRTDLNRAWDVLFADLPYLSIHGKFTARTIARYKRAFRQVDHIKSPEWIGYDVQSAGKALHALTAADTVNYAFLAVLATAHSTGASGVSGAGAGVGAAGSGAGGGGGGAG